MSTVQPAGRSPANVQKHPGLHTILLIGGAVIIGVLLVASWLMWSKPLYESSDTTLRWGPTCLLIAIAYLLLALRKVSVDYSAGAFFYGKALVHLPSGLHFVPPGLMQLDEASRTVQEFQCPGEPEKVFKEDDKEKLPEGMVRPIRIVTRAPIPGKEATEILNTQMSFVVSFVFQYVVKDIFDYKQNFGDAETVHIQLRDIGETTVAEYATKRTTSQFIKDLPKLNLLLRAEVEKRFGNSGIDIISARLISPDITHDVSSALAGIPIERAKAQQTVIKADAEKARRQKEREGDAAGELAWLTAEAEGRKKIKDALKVGGEEVLASEAVRGILDKTDVILAGGEGGMKDVMAFVKGAQSAFNSGTKKGVTP